MLSVVYLYPCQRYNLIKDFTLFLHYEDFSFDVFSLFRYKSSDGMLERITNSVRVYQSEQNIIIDSIQVRDYLFKLPFLVPHFYPHD